MMRIASPPSRLVLGLIGLLGFNSAVWATSEIASASIDWNSYSVSVIPQSGSPILNWNAGTLNDVSSASANAASNSQSASDWTTGTTISVADGSAFGTATTPGSAGRFLSSLATVSTGGNAISYATRSGNFTITGGSAIVLVSADASISVQPDPAGAASWSTYATANLILSKGTVGTGSYSSGYDALSLQYDSSSVPPLSPTTLSGTLHATLFFNSGETGTFTANPYTSVSLAPVPLPAAVWLMFSALVGMVVLARRRSF